MITTDPHCGPFLAVYNHTDCGIASASEGQFRLCIQFSRCPIAGRCHRLYRPCSKLEWKIPWLNVWWLKHILFYTGGSVGSKLLRHPGSTSCICAAAHDRPCPQRSKVTPLLCLLKCAWRRAAAQHAWQLIRDRELHSLWIMSCTTEWTWQWSNLESTFTFSQRKTLQCVLSPRRSKWLAKKLKSRPDTWALASWVNECETLSVVVEHNGKLIKGGSYFSIMVWRVGSCIDRDGVIQGEIRPILIALLIIFEWRHNAALAPGDSTGHSVSTSIMVEQAALLWNLRNCPRSSLLEHTSGPGEHCWSRTQRHCTVAVGEMLELRPGSSTVLKLEEPCWACTSDKCSPKGEES